MHGHGGNIYRMASDLRVGEADIVDFSASINPLAMPEAVRAAIADSMDRVLHYPDPDNSRLRRALSERYAIDADRIVCGNGSTELIYLLPRALKPRRVVIASPTFTEYERACLLAGAEVEHFGLLPDNGFLPQADAFGRAMEGADMAFFCNPGNPSGRAAPRSVVEALIGSASSSGCVLVVDEAFAGFCPEYSVIDIENPCLVVLRSLTKFYGLAGLRSGFAVVPAALAGRAMEFKEPWSMNVLAESASVAAVADDEFESMTLRYMAEEKPCLEGEFVSLGIEFFPSDANYYLLRFEGARHVARELMKRGIAVRDCSNFRGLDSSYVRVAVRSRDENRLLVRGIAEILRGVG